MQEVFRFSQEVSRLERAEAIPSADRLSEFRRQLVREGERQVAVHALNSRNSAMSTTAGRIFKSVDWFLPGQSRLDEFPARLFCACPDDIRWRFCADALRDGRVPRTTKARSRRVRRGGLPARGRSGKARSYS
jgi:hypothetical protein